MKLLKLSEAVYGSGFSVMHHTYLSGFPQREAFLFSALAGWEIYWYRHEVLSCEDTVQCESRKLAALLRELELDLIVYDNPTSSQLIPTDRRSTAVFDVCDWYLDYYAREHGTDEGWFRLRTSYAHAVATADRFLFQSTTIAHHVFDSRQVPTDRYCVIPNGYDEEIFYFREDSEPDSLRRLHGVAGKLAVFAGKLGRWYSHILDVADCLPADWTLLIAGDGPIRGQLDRHEKVRCLGRLDPAAVADVVRSADVCVLPVDDCSPIATSEYLACGKPVVHLGDRICWMIEDGANGFVVPNGRNNWRRKILEAYEHRNYVRKPALATPRSWQQLRVEVSETLCRWAAR